MRIFVVCGYAYQHLILWNLNTIKKMGYRNNLSIVYHQDIPHLVIQDQYKLEFSVIPIYYSSSCFIGYDHQGFYDKFYELVDETMYSQMPLGIKCLTKSTPKKLKKKPMYNNTTMLVVSQSIELTKSQQRSYEKSFFQVFRNKSLFTLIFDQMSKIHSDSGKQFRRYRHLTSNYLVKNGQYNLLKEKMRDDRLFLFTKTAVVTWCRKVKSIAEFLEIQSYQPMFFDQLDKSMIFKNICIGGCLELVQYCYEQQYPLTYDCVHNAVAFGHFPVVKYLTEQCKIFKLKGMSPSTVERPTKPKSNARFRLSDLPCFQKNPEIKARDNERKKSKYLATTNHHSDLKKYLSKKLLSKIFNYDKRF
ncbi:hypothetical protein DLAC_10370 [Tieghemostelium lacteum]|uniref:Ankyrin repeat-containing protein n=1 Tax=Tieghemostelium lacteum TaxID=361077 RepID=A0A151Z592_TIELA|nr:hypothetical protein DLAC_10370 [Tieghemostelium lacteum]|eukprot:KYQ89130.1 hypothetical protein DLAC_10370 [Tieghemostelium lacteum]